MPILRDPSPDVQALAARLSAYQRMLLGKAGMPRWFALAYPWEPAPGRQTHEAQRLAAPSLGLLATSPTFLGAYELTLLGEQVAAVFLMNLCQDQQRAETLAYALTPLQRSVACLVATLGVLFAANSLPYARWLLLMASLTRNMASLRPMALRIPAPSSSPHWARPLWKSCCWGCAMDSRKYQLFLDLDFAPRMVLLRMVAEACRSLHCWGTSCTTFTTWQEVVPDADLGQVCRVLVAKGLILDLGADDLGLYRPTLAGVQLVTAWLLRYIAYPPTGECSDV
ncbi:MAG: hypothetical protein H0U76_02890 [Ktedonobacteraceae bacterium]|nr:hypothetical protein [Ktedonobacteraceae bacterium]MBA3824323.1 hypothetical protein [Ktedonobacterales bacterium]